MARVAVPAVLMALAVLGGRAREARAENGERGPTALSWVRLAGAEHCPDLKAIAAAVDARLGRGAFVPAAEASVLIEASVQDDRAGDAIRVRINVVTAKGEALGTRDLQLDGQDCRAATDTAALAIALMIDPNAATDAPKTASIADFPREAPQAEPTSPPSGEPVRRLVGPRLVGVREASNARVPEPWRTRLALAALGAVGQLPEPTLGVLGAVRLSPRPARVGIEAAFRYLSPQSAELRPNAGGRFSAMTAELSGFAMAIKTERVALAVLAGVQVGSLFARGYGFGVSNSYDQSRLVNVALGADVAFVLGRGFGLLLRPTLQLPLLRDAFEASRNGESTRIFRAPAVLGDLAVGLVFDP